MKSPLFYIDFQIDINVVICVAEIRVGGGRVPMETLIMANTIMLEFATTKNVVLRLQIEAGRF
jgi:hypothetical protein